MQRSRREICLPLERGKKALVVAFSPEDQPALFATMFALIRQPSVSISLSLSLSL